MNMPTKGFSLTHAPRALPPLPNLTARVVGPSHDEIATRAFEIYLASGSITGRCTQNWQQAELSFHGHGQASRHAQELFNGAIAPFPTTAR